MNRVPVRLADWHLNYARQAIKTGNDPESAKTQLRKGREAVGEEETTFFVAHSRQKFGIENSLPNGDRDEDHTA